MELFPVAEVGLLKGLHTLRLGNMSMDWAGHQSSEDLRWLIRRTFKSCILKGLRGHKANEGVQPESTF
jgi:hypothetical protein